MGQIVCRIVRTLLRGEREAMLRLLRIAVDQAQNAETSATTVQLVSVCFSVFIAVLLTYAGSIWQLSIATVLMYQAAWSALSIAVCALKQHS